MNNFGQPGVTGAIGPTMQIYKFIIMLNIRDNTFNFYTKNNENFIQTMNSYNGFNRALQFEAICNYSFDIINNDNSMPNIDLYIEAVEKFKKLEALL